VQWTDRLLLEVAMFCYHYEKQVGNYLVPKANATQISRPDHNIVTNISNVFFPQHAVITRIHFYGQMDRHIKKL
jgi:subtilase family serine protease